MLGQRLRRWPNIDATLDGSSVTLPDLDMLLTCACVFPSLSQSTLIIVIVPDKWTITQQSLEKLLSSANKMCLEYQSLYIISGLV